MPKQWVPGDGAGGGTAKAVQYGQDDITVSYLKRIKRFICPEDTHIFSFFAKTCILKQFFRKRGGYAYNDKHFEFEEAAGAQSRNIL